MHKAPDQYLPNADVRCIQLDHVTVLSAPHIDQHATLSATGEEVWALLHERRSTVDRLVMAMAKRYSGQALADIPERVIEQLDSFVSQGFVRRVADA